MARLQRKKTTKPKKKRQGDGDADSGNGPQGSTGANEAVKPAVREVRKPGPVPQKKALTTREEPGKLGGWVSTAVQFLREVKVELKKVAWPSRKQTVGSTVVVLILVTIIAFFLGAVDIALSSLIRVVLH
jgi:preprotein translocase subunit SecE